MIAVFVPFQILAAILFAMTAGSVQMNGGVTIRICANLSTIPQSLTPAPPHDSNFAQVCRTSLFGIPTGALLTVARVTREGSTTTRVMQTYMLDKQGNVINGLAIDGYVMLAFLVYLVGMIWRSGRTLGDRAVKTKVIDVTAPDVLRVPLRKAITRYLAMAIGVVPVFAILIYHLVVSGGIADAAFTPTFFQWIVPASVLAMIWGVILLIQIAMKKDPAYDRLAGTAVVRT